VSTNRDFFFEHAGVPMALVDATGRLIEVNPTFYRLAGQRAIDALDAIFVASDRPAVEAALAAAKSGGHGTFEARFDKGEVGIGASRWFAFRLEMPTPDAPGCLTGWDVTEARVEQERMRVLSRLLEATPVVLTSADRDGAITLADGHGLDVLGFASADVLGLDIRELYRDTGLGPVIERAYGGEDAFLRYTYRNGATFDHWYTCIRGADGEVEGVISIAVDTTAQASAERELLDKLHEISAKDAQIRAMATPILKVWNGVLCMPIVGGVDAERAGNMMGALLDEVTRSQARHVIIDMTGVEVLDTASAHFVLRLFKAASVLGVKGYLCGIQPQVASAIVSLGVAVTGIESTLDLEDALRRCIGVGRVTALSGKARRP
jgi:rsbT co-antagonist protein RsbR